MVSLRVQDFCGIPYSNAQGTTDTKKLNKCTVSTYGGSKRIIKGPVRYLCIKMFKVVIFTQSKKKKQPKCPIIKQWFSKVWYNIVLALRTTFGRIFQGIKLTNIII